MARTYAGLASPLSSHADTTHGFDATLADAADRLLERAIAAARAGRRTDAIRLLDQALALRGDHVDTLLWRGGLSEPGEALGYIERACAVEPDNQRAREGLAWAQQRLPAPAVQVTTAPAAVEDAPTAPSRLQAPPSPRVHDAGRVLLRRIIPAVLAIVLLLGVLGLVSAAQVGQGSDEGQHDHELAAAVIPPPGTSLPAAFAGGAASASPAAGASGSPMTTTLLPSVAPTGAPVISAKATARLAVSPTATPVISATATARLAASPTAAPDISATTTARLAPSPTAAPAVQVISSPVISATTVITAPAALDEAWTAGDWPQVIPVVEAMLKAKPGDGALVEKLFSAHFNYAVQLVRSERLAEAVAEFDQALVVVPGDQRALSERRFAQLYLQGSAALSQGDFAAAITPLDEIYSGNPNYRSVKTRLYQAYLGSAGALENNGKATEAYLAYEKALNVDTQGSEAQAGTTRLKSSAPAGSAAGKKIEVDIAKQQVTAYDNGKVVYRFKASTGKSPYLTRTGNFRILSKMPNAYSSAMQWGMPWWMGIYYAGKWENGFHAMARVGKNQTVLPNSMLGKPATHGCIMLSDKDAKTLYDWAVIGTAVWIH